MGVNEKNTLYKWNLSAGIAQRTTAQVGVMKNVQWEGRGVLLANFCADSNGGRRQQRIGYSDLGLAQCQIICQKRNMAKFTDVHWRIFLLMHDLQLLEDIDWESSNPDPGKDLMFCLTYVPAFSLASL